MPWGDRTGPFGAGPMTGRRAGYCAGYSTPGYMNPGPAYGRGLGRGRGFGWRRRYYATGVPGWARYGAYEYAPPVEAEEEKKFLEQELGYLKKEIEAVEKRLDELKKEEE